MKTSHFKNPTAYMEETKMKNLLGALAVIALWSTGCTTAEKVTKVEGDNSRITVFSSPDKRSTLPDAQSSRPMEKAVNKLAAEVKTNPADVKSLLNLAQIKVVGAQLDEAEALAKQVLRLDLKNSDAKKLLAEVALRRDNYDLADIILSGLGGSASKDSQILNMLALISLRKGESSQAMALFKRALQLNPEDVSVRMNLGVMQLKFRQLNAAAVQFERVLRTVPGHLDAKLHLAVIKMSRGQKAEAVEIYKSILAVRKDNPLALFNLAVVQKQGGEFDDALDNLKRYLKTRPTDGNQTSEAFALIDEIQNERAARGEQVSDEEIQTLAARMAETRDAPRSDRGKVASRTAPREQEAVTAPVKPAQQVVTTPRPGQATAASKAAPAPAKRAVHETDDIGELEKALE